MPSICEAAKVHQIEHILSWMDRFIKYLIDGVIPDNPFEGCRFKWKVSQFTLVNNHLYKKSFSLPLLKYVQPDEADYIL